jgi:hypothetical protein
MTYAKNGHKWDKWKVINIYWVGSTITVAREI